ncbi:uncharacterized protein ColSpa_12484 [Colletotrichum spaethianum]|uniref:Uncharacterized protein n=1 Tax=Colletotrichum spaethianum TaxID=700344 RepID=A0AA37PHJ2_9PEZI|nr:uncharacterized protein ColSpa_12484 [Colletotrichum spaethianum]GKT52303.1 hypothetical protein ColSpa_12484 [Colletotrichum spaethianum]
MATYGKGGDDAVGADWPIRRLVADNHQWRPAQKLGGEGSSSGERELVDQSRSFVVGAPKERSGTGRRRIAGSEGYEVIPSGTTRFLGLGEALPLGHSFEVAHVPAAGAVLVRVGALGV